MAKTDHKAKKAKQRKESNRKRKAAVISQPRVLRQNPDLAEVLSTRHPLLGYFVNPDWQTAKMATVQVIREAPTGQVFGSFLVDLLERGTKDSFGNFGLVDALGELARIRRESHMDEAPIPLAPATAINLIRGGVEWARRWRFPPADEIDLWIKLVDPADELDLTIFGDHGERPIYLHRLDGPLGPLSVDEFEEEEEWELEGEEDEDEAEALLPPPTRLWIPGANATQPPADDDQPKTNSGLWLPS